MLEDTRSWPFIEARKILERIGGVAPAKGYVLFETGYGPSGLPHIGTFGEVARTSMVQHAFELISDIPTKLVAFSDDMDGLRKAPDNVPNKELLEANLGKRLTKVPDPFGKFGSFAHHNNAMLCEFLDRFGFDYEFVSSTEMYNSGIFNETLKLIYDHYDEIQTYMLSTLREERASTYSPFLPVSWSDKVLQVPVELLGNYEIKYLDPETNEYCVTGITNGQVKLQWKVDWAMRWMTFDVNYEMSGKDLISSVEAAQQICKIIGRTPPINLTYELFLDENGQKVSKSKGNGISLETWLKYGPKEALSLFLFQNPKGAKKLGMGSIARTTDEYISHLVKYHKDDTVAAFDNPVFHIHSGDVPKVDENLTFGILLNLANVGDITDRNMMWKYIQNLYPDKMPTNSPFIDRLVGYAINTYQDMVKPTKMVREATLIEKIALAALTDVMEKLPDDATGEEIQYWVYEIGKKFYPTNLKGFFQMLYEVLLGQSSGPRMGFFFELYGNKESIVLLRSKL